jgi:2-iminobutanoate/2-iminopropanoate deaminase
MQFDNIRDYHLISLGTHEGTSASTTTPKTEYLYLSGALGFDAETNTLPDCPVEQTKNLMKNISAILKQAGSSYNSIIRAHLYLSSSSFEKEVEAEYQKWFQGLRLPVKTNIIVKQLPRAGKVELDLVASIESSKQIKNITSDKVPPAIGPFVTSKRASHKSSLIFTSAMGIDPKSDALASNDISGQTKQAMTNLKSILGRAGSSLSNVLRCTIYITDMAHFLSLNEEYSKWFQPGEFPTRTCIAVSKLPRNALVQIDLSAVEEPIKKFQTITYENIPKNTEPSTIAKKIRSFTPLTYMSGIVGVDEKGNLGKSVKEQTHNILKTLARTAKNVNSSLDKVIKATVYLADMADYNEMNEEYAKWFTKGNEPVRLCVGLPELPQKARVQMEFVIANQGFIRPKL